MNPTQQPPLFHLPLESIQHILSYVILPNDDIVTHFSACTDLRCELVDGIIARTRKIRLISRFLSRALDSSPIGCICIRISNAYNPFSASFPPSHINITNALSIDIDVDYITTPLISSLIDAAYETKKIVRLSIAGRRTSPEGPLFRSISDPVRRILANNKTTRAILLDVDMDSYHLLLAYNAHHYLNAIHITNRSTTYAIANPTPVWTELRSLSIYTEHSASSTPNAFTLFPVGSLPNVTRVVLYSDDERTIQYLPIIFNSIKPTVTNLKLTFVGLQLNLPSFPSSETLRNFACNYDQASTILTGVYNSLSSIQLHGFAPIEQPAANHPLPTPGLRVSRLVSNTLTCITQTQRTPGLRRVILDYPIASSLSNLPTNTHESLLYAYWVTELRKRRVRLLDANEEQIMPNSPPLSN